MSKETARLLLVDDDEDVLLAAKLLLKKHFTNIVTANTPEKISRLLNETAFDLAMLDMNYSAGATNGREGFKLLRHIKSTAPNTRVIMMTAYGDIDLAIKAIKEGAVDFIVKPWDNAKLVSTVLGALKMGITSSGSNIPEEMEIGDGQYTRPFSEVERIFMFLDIKSSTTIAENLGHVRYFELLNDFFRDIAEPISRYKGHIYQYVGDEVVVTWNMEDGLEQANCLHCFFGIVDAIEALTNRYMHKYAIKPAFKAGMHFGKVSMGTVGTLKKEIIYTGDVLNTASRIEGLCNKHGVDLLMSKDLIDRLPSKSHFKPREIGAISLRGKSTEVTLYTANRI